MAKTKNQTAKAHRERLERRLKFLEDRIKTSGDYPRGNFDKAEASALRWALENLEPAPETHLYVLTIRGPQGDTQEAMELTEAEASGLAKLAAKTKDYVPRIEFN